VLLTINVQIFEFSQDMIVVGKVCDEDGHGDADIDEAQASGLGGLRQRDTPAYLEFEEIRLRIGHSAQFHGNIAGQMR
jgi:hypothetical protein